jgi:hypothetical protein
LKNLSGIKTQFKLASLEFEPLNHVAPSEKSEIQKAMEEAEAAKMMRESTLSGGENQKTP